MVLSKSVKKIEPLAIYRAWMPRVEICAQKGSRAARYVKENDIPLADDCEKN